MEKDCPVCSKKFECRHNQIESCQCEKVILNEKAKDYIKQNFQDCLCLACLEKIAHMFP